MIFDKQNLFSDAQAVTTGTIVSTNLIDRGPVGTPKHAKGPLVPDLGAGTKVPVLAQVVEDFAGGTSVKVQIQQSVDAAFTSPIVVAETAAIVTATLKAGYKFAFDTLPQGLTARYVRLAYVVVGTHTAGKITAGIVLANEEPWI